MKENPFSGREVGKAVKRSRKKTGQTGQWLSAAMAAVLVCTLIPAGGALWAKLGPGLDSLTQKAAVFSAALAMPEGSIYLLEQRFSGDLAQPDQPEPEPSSSLAPPASSSQSSGSAPSRKPDGPIPEVDPQFRGTIIEEDLSGRSGGVYQPIGAGLLRNYTDITDQEIDAILAQPLTQTLGSGNLPQILIMHTHATESYEPYDRSQFDTRGTWRSTNNDENMVVVGNELARVLEENGFSVLHDTTQHDYPSYNGAYDRSAKTVKEYLAKYPSIRVVLDIHRDAIGTSTQITKPVIEIDGQKAAQVMVVSCCDSDGSLGVPNWKENLRFAAALTNAIAEDHPGLCRPLFFAHRKYNMNLTTGSLLLEFGSHANTLEEATYTATLVGESLSRLLQGWLPQ